MAQRNNPPSGTDVPPYKLLEHTADIGFEVCGRSRRQIFEHAALAFCDMMWNAGPGNFEQRKLEVTGTDTDELMVNFLEEFLYLHEAKRLLFSRVRVETMTDHRLVASIWGRVIDEGDELLLVVKAVTYHQLFVGRDKDGWRARVFLDI